MRGTRPDLFQIGEAAANMLAVGLQHYPVGSLLGRENMPDRAAACGDRLEPHLPADPAWVALYNRDVRGAFRRLELVHDDWRSESELTALLLESRSRFMDAAAIAGNESDVSRTVQAEAGVLVVCALLGSPRSVAQQVDRIETLVGYRWSKVDTETREICDGALSIAKKRDLYDRSYPQETAPGGNSGESFTEEIVRLHKQVYGGGPTVLSETVMRTLTPVELPSDLSRTQHCRAPRRRR